LGKSGIDESDCAVAEQHRAAAMMPVKEVFFTMAAPRMGVDVRQPLESFVEREVLRFRPDGVVGVALDEQNRVRRSVGQIAK
jgi:hypothetical protein